ncbi:MAG: glycosyltransferase family 4 protein [Candidatus Bathyarchaeia archaeon]|jgi:glycosyltransferase involved in cell wall biosynthesis
MMRVLIASNELYPITGGAVGTLYIGRKFSERGHEVTLTGPLHSERSKAERELGFKVIPFNLPFQVSKFVPIRGPRYLAYAFSFIPHFLKLAPFFDFILIRNCLVGLSGSFASIIRRSGCMAISLSDLLAGFLKEDPFYPKFLSDILLLAEKQIPKSFPLVFVVSPLMKRELTRAGVPAQVIEVTFDGVDVNRFDPNIEPAVVFDKPTVISFGSLDWHHGAHLLIDIVKEVQKRQDVQFMIVGGGPAYPYLARKLKGQPYVLMTNFVPYGSLPSYIASSDLGIIPYPKNYSLDLVLTLKLLETLSMARPVVCSNLASVKEVFGGYEFLKIGEDLKTFADRILEIINLPRSERKRIGLRGRELVTDKFSWDVVTTAMVTKCEKLFLESNRTG